MRSEIGDRVIENEDLVNLPNWLLLNFRIADGDWFSLAKVEILDYIQELGCYRRRPHPYFSVSGMLRDGKPK